jgi:hypothetical protein
VNPNLKKDYIITSKKAITYLQSYIIDRAVTVAGMDADTALIQLSFSEIIKILKKIRTYKNKTLYLNKIKRKSIT